MESKFLKVVRVSHQPIFPLAYTCPTQVIFLDFLVAPKTSLVLSLLPCFLLSLFFLATPYLFFDFLKETRRLKKLSPSLKPTGPHIKRKIRLHLVSSFYSFKATRTIKNSLPFIPTGPTPKERKALTNSPPSLTETIYLFLRNQTLTKVLASIVGKYICLFSVMVILIVEWFAFVSVRNTEICSIVFLNERINMNAFI